LERDSDIGTRRELRADIKSNFLHCTTSHLISGNMRRSANSWRWPTHGALRGRLRCILRRHFQASRGQLQRACMGMSSLVGKLEGGFCEDAGSGSGVRRRYAFGFVVTDTILAGDKDHPRRAEIV